MVLFMIQVKEVAIIGPASFRSRHEMCTLRRDSIPILPDWPAQFPKLFFLKPKLNINAVF